MKTKLTLEEAVELHKALTALDGYAKSIEMNGRPVVINQPYNLGKTRNKVLRNVMALDPYFEPYEAARIKLVRHFSEGGAEVPQEKQGAFEDAHEALLKDKVCEVELDAIEKDDLALERNPIPSSVSKVIVKLLKPEFEPPVEPGGETD